MSPTMRQSPLHDALTAMSPAWGALNGMHAALAMPGDSAASDLLLADASCLARVGVKGPRAEAWLAAQGIAVPQGVNAWAGSPDGSIVARLARSEFFLEDGFRGDTVERLRGRLASAPGLYPVLRQDAAIVLAGKRAAELLVQTCNVNFEALMPDRQAVVMTTMVGVAVLVLWQRTDAGLCYRIWCDSTFGPYLWETLLEIAGEMGGRAAGLRIIFPSAGI